MKLIFMGTPDFAVPSLKRLIEAGHTIEAVFTQPDKPVGRMQIVTPPPIKIFALERGLTVYQPEKIKTAAAREQIEPIVKSADVCVVAAYGRILPEWMIEAPRYGCINVHSSLLPKYRGAAPINWAIANGETETGVTIMQMDVGMDTGAMLMQGRTEIGESEIAPKLTSRLAEMGADLLVETLELLQQGKLHPRAQNDSEASYAPMLKREDGQVDWNMTAHEIINRIRGFNPFPGCYSFLNGQKIEIIQAMAMEGDTPDLAGSVCEVGKDYFSVACGGSTQLRITDVQPAGKRPMSARDFLNGAKLTVGTFLGE